VCVRERDQVGGARSCSWLGGRWARVGLNFGVLGFLDGGDVVPSYELGYFYGPVSPLIVWAVRIWTRRNWA